MGYRCDNTTGIPTGDAAETMYMVASGTYHNSECCFDYGNAETNNDDDGRGTMEAVSIGTHNDRQSGVGEGPWILADLEVQYATPLAWGLRRLFLLYAYLLSLIGGVFHRGFYLLSQSLAAAIRHTASKDYRYCTTLN